MQHFLVWVFKKSVLALLCAWTFLRTQSTFDIFTTSCSFMWWGRAGSGRDLKLVMWCLAILNTYAFSIRDSLAHWLVALAFLDNALRPFGSELLAATAQHSPTTAFRSPCSSFVLGSVHTLHMRKSTPCVHTCGILVCLPQRLCVVQHPGVPISDVSIQCVLHLDFRVAVIQ